MSQAERAKAFDQVLREREVELNLHCRAIADILQTAGEKDPINHLALTSRDMPAIMTIHWTREADEQETKGKAPSP